MKFLVAAAVMFLGALTAQATELKLDGGEIGNAYVPFQSLIGDYSLEYPAGWQKNDLSQLTSFADVKPAGATPSFLSVLTDRFPGMNTLDDLARHLRFFRADALWVPYELAGVRGFVAEVGDLKLVYLLRQAEDVIAIRYRSTDGERSDKALAHMLGSFRLQ